MSPPELVLWSKLRRLSCDLPRFRRQHPIGPYIADLYCPAAKLVVEVDGWGHNMGDEPERDARRDAWMAERGLVVRRISAGELMRDLDTIVEGVLRQAAALAPPPPSASPPPPPLRRGG